MESYVSGTGVSTYNYDYASNHSNAFLSAGCVVTFIDEFVNQLLYEERECDITMPRIPKHAVLEENGELAPRQSRLLDSMEGKDEGPIRGRSRSAAAVEKAASVHAPARRRIAAGAQCGQTLSVADHGEDDTRNGSRSRPRPAQPSPLGLDGRFRSRSRRISPDPVS
jgi:PRP38 family